jgi:GINS complex subunit 3
LNHRHYRAFVVERVATFLDVDSKHMPSSYYDIDAILAEEELVPCTTMFDFSHLAHLDGENFTPDKHYLPEKSRIKMPVWAIQKWATLGFVRLSLPKHFSRKARERLEADPSDADLRYALVEE